VSTSPPLRTGECSQSLPKELQPRILDVVHAKKIIQRLNDVQDVALHRYDSRLRLSDDLESYAIGNIKALTNSFSGGGGITLQVGYLMLIGK
jgi:hypothetical protein